MSVNAREERFDHAKEYSKFKLRPASPDEAELFYSASPDKDAELGTIGHVRIDFGKSGDEFWHTWWQRGDEALNSTEFKTELDELARELRSHGPLSDLEAMSRYCYEHGGAIEGGYAQSYGFISETENYRFCLRCIPVAGDYNAYLTAYDLRVQKQNIAQAEPNEAPSTEMTMDGM